MPILLGRSFPLRHGWTGVVNRSQQDIDTNKQIDSAQSSEGLFFFNHASYRVVADRCGSRVLGERCNKLLSEHIRKTLPELRNQIKDRIQIREEELTLLGEPVFEDEASAGWQLMNLLAKFSLNFSDAIQGNLATLEKSNDPTHLSGGARIRYIFNDVFARSLSSANPVGNLTSLEIRTAIRNAQGSKPALFVPDAAFEHLARKMIDQLRAPCLQAADTVYNELLRIVAELDTKEINRFWKLREKISESVNDMIRKQLKEAQKLINISLELELSYINTAHPDFVGMSIINPTSSGSHNPKGENPSQSQGHGIKDNDEDFSLSSGDRVLPTSEGQGLLRTIFGRTPKPDATSKPNPSTPKPQTPRQDSPVRNDDPFNEKERAQVTLIRQLLDSYFKIVMKKLHDHITKLLDFKIVMKKLHDNITKVVMMVLVNEPSANMNKYLVSHIYKGDGNYRNLLAEMDNVALQRNIARQELDALKRAKQVIKLSELSDGL